MIPNITTGADFQDLLDYLVENREHELIDLRGVSSVALAAEEMAAVAALNNRARNKLIHVSLSAAHEDGVLAGDTWLQAVERHERAFGLVGHQRVIVRHKDKTHDHVHVFWCTISPETGHTPTKRWFLKKGFAIDDVGPQALTDEQVERVPAAHRARRTYDFILLRRAQHLCRQLEKELGLRELRSPEQAAHARAAGAEKGPTIGQQKRAERTGSAPLIERAADIRTALDAPDWPSTRRALAAIGLDLEPVFRTTKAGEELRGLVIFDMADPGNRMKASQLDTATRKYGFRKLEERHMPGAETLDRWWPTRGSLPFAAFARATLRVATLNAAYDVVLAQHRLAEAQKRRELKRLREKEKRAIAAKRAALLQDRKTLAASMPVAERRAFYASYERDVRAAALGAIMDEFRHAAAPLQRARQPSWSEFLRASAKAGDLDAMRCLEGATRALRQADPRQSERYHGVVQEVDRMATWQPPLNRLESEDRSESFSAETLLQAIIDGRGQGR